MQSKGIYFIHKDFPEIMLTAALTEKSMGNIEKNERIVKHWIIDSQKKESLIMFLIDLIILGVKEEEISYHYDQAKINYKMVARFGDSIGITSIMQDMNDSFNAIYSRAKRDIDCSGKVWRSFFTGNLANGTHCATAKHPLDSIAKVAKSLGYTPNYSINLVDFLNGMKLGAKCQ